MRFTMSKDGQLRTTLRIERRVGREDLATLLCQYLVATDDFEDLFEESSDDFETLPIPRGRKWVIDTARAMLSRYGEESWAYWSDDIGDDLADQVRAWAEGTVNQAFPELSS